MATTKHSKNIVGRISKYKQLKIINIYYFTINININIYITFLSLLKINRSFKSNYDKSLQKVKIDTVQFGKFLSFF